MSEVILLFTMKENGSTEYSYNDGDSNAIRRRHDNNDT